MKKSKRYVARIAALLFGLAMMTSVLAMPSAASQLNADGTAYQAGDAYPTTLQNPSFETQDPALTAVPAASNVINPSALPGWSTSGSDGKIELWSNGFHPGTGANANNPFNIVFSTSWGAWFAEINANATSTPSLYQDLSTQAGTLYVWSFWHRGRTGTDAAQMRIGDPNGPDVDASGLLPATDAQPAAAGFNGVPGLNSNGSAYAGPDPTVDPTALVAPQGVTGNSITNWTPHMGYYTAPVPTGDAIGDTTVTRFQLFARYSAKGGFADTTLGNLVDNANWQWAAQPTPAAIKVGDTIPSLVTVNTDLVDPSGSAIELTAVPGTGMPSDSSTPGIYNVTYDIKDGQTMIGQVNSQLTVGPIATLNQVDQNGDPIFEPQVTNFSAGEDYVAPVAPAVGSTVVGDDGNTYAFVRAEGDLTDGTMDADSNMVVTFHYQLQHMLTLNFVDANGQPLQDPTQTFKDDGSAYAAPQIGDEITINGKVFVVEELASGSDPASGTMDGDRAVTLILVPKDSGPVTGYTLYLGAVGALAAGSLLVVLAAGKRRKSAAGRAEGNSRH